jgi:hypothetical protein
MEHENTQRIAEILLQYIRECVKEEVQKQNQIDPKELFRGLENCSLSFLSLNRE